MNHTLLNYEKQRFIEYILYQYDFKNPESVWILNLLKSSPKYLSNLSFVKELNDKRVLSISTTYSNQLPLLYCKDYFCLDNGRQIFHDIRLDNSHLNVLLYLNKKDDRLNRILLLQMIIEHFGDDEHIRLINKQSSNTSLQHWKNWLTNEIDYALDHNDQENFLKMTKIMQFINELEEH
nr:YpiB family protein [Mammaliicoccus sp. Marseille-Q6498]